MAGTSAPIVTTNVMRGPMKLFLNVGLPAAGAAPTLHTDGTPDSVASPNALYLGGTKEGAKFIAEHTEEEERMDELSAPYRTHIVQESARIEGVLLELLDFTRLSKLVPNGVLATGTGYIRITAGGLLTITAIPILMTAPNPADPTKFITWMLYSAYNKNPLEINLSRTSRAEVPFSFMGLAVPGRAAGDQLWQMNQQVT